MGDSREELARLLDDCVVRVHGPVARGGSGFFVAPGMIVTCAHVVGAWDGDDDGVVPVVDEVLVQWRGLDHTGLVVKAVPPTYSGDGLWKFPDLALIKLTGRRPDHPCAWLGDAPLRYAARLYATGFHSTYEQGMPGRGGASLEYVAPQDFDGQALWKVKEDELAPGMSGGPVLDWWQGAVCAVVKTSRDVNWPVGGLVTPASMVKQCFPEVWEQNLRLRLEDNRWRDLRIGSRHASARSQLLTADEESRLYEICGPLQPDYHALYRQVAGEMAPEPRYPLRDVRGLVREVADVNVAPDGSPHPLVLACERLAELSNRRTARRLYKLARQITERQGLPYKKGDAGLAGAVSHDASIEIHLIPSGPDPDLHGLAVWTYRDIDDLPVQAICLETPMSLDEIRTVISGRLPELIDGLGGADRMSVEFVLPLGLVHKAAVDEWDLGDGWVSLGEQFTVIIRTLERPKGTMPHWQKRWNELQGEGDAGVDWVDCRRPGDRRRLYAAFRNSERLAVVGMAYVPLTTAGEHALEAALKAGLPAALWPRRPCPEHESGPGAPGAPAGESECTGDKFVKAIAPRLHEKPLRELPETVRQLRTEAMGDETHCGRALTLLWDDPTRPFPDDNDLVEPL